MLVRDGIVEKMFVEPEEPGDPFKVPDRHFCATLTKTLASLIR